MPWGVLRIGRRVALEAPDATLPMPPVVTGQVPETGTSATRSVTV
jgi:hypothetical protein